VDAIIANHTKRAMNLPTKIIPVELVDGTVIKVEATPIGEQKVSFHSRPFQEFITSLKTMVSEIADPLREIQQAVKPDKMSITMGVDVSIESGQLTTLLVKGGGSANLEITIEWDK
jgi:hypothetical protein